MFVPGAVASTLFLASVSAKDRLATDRSFVMENSLIVRLVTRDSPVSIEKAASNREKRKQRFILCE